jgi:hypothetical protein
MAIPDTRDFSSVRLATVCRTLKDVFEKQNNVINQIQQKTNTNINKNIRLPQIFLLERSRYTSVSTATGCGLDDRGSITDRDKRFFSAPQRPDRFWGPPNLISN